MRVQEQEEKPINYYVSHKYMAYYVLYVEEPNHYKTGTFPYNFPYWRRQIDLLCPYRVSSIVKENYGRKRKLKFIFDHLVEMIAVEKRIKKEFPGIRVTSFKHLTYYTGTK